MPKINLTKRLPKKNRESSNCYCCCCYCCYYCYCFCFPRCCFWFCCFRCCASKYFANDAILQKTKKEKKLNFLFVFIYFFFSFLIKRQPARRSPILGVTRIHRHTQIHIRHRVCVCVCVCVYLFVCMFILCLLLCALNYANDIISLSDSNKYKRSSLAYGAYEHITHIYTERKRMCERERESQSRTHMQIVIRLETAYNKFSAEFII